jgi:hypothetical protein
MKKQLKTTTVYTPNTTVKLSVTNKPVFDEVGTSLGFDTDVTIKIKLIGQANELKFATDDAISDFVNNIDYTDPQMRLV